jgi:hypothetical protein
VGNEVGAFAPNDGGAVPHADPVAPTTPKHDASKNLRIETTDIDHLPDPSLAP